MSDATRYGAFSGPIVATFLIEDGEDYHIQLLEPLAFTDPQGVTITVPAGFVVDGATIPAVLWPLIGSPLSGDYRRASVIHDWETYHKKRNADYPQSYLHISRRFYYAMRCDGVGWFRANAMYLAVLAYNLFHRYQG